MGICPHCGRANAVPEALGGLCPECLMKAGFATNASIGGAVQFPYTPPTPEELAGFFPQLEILELIGRGGMGAVYKARQKQLDRMVALKILPPHISSDPSFADRFAREAKALAKLNHPNIVTLYEFGQADGLFYFLMEYVDGVNLRQLLGASRLSAREALAIVPQICDALQYAHDAGIVHRDIKPENILMDRRGRVKVADFGLAKLIGNAADAAGSAVPAGDAGSVTEVGKVMGTPQYMAPEQTEHPSEVDHRADIYSLGVVFYQMLTGELPKGDFAPPSKKVVVDVRLDEVVLRAMEKRPELRYQQVSDVKTMVETIATNMHAGSPLTSPSVATGVAPGNAVMPSVLEQENRPKKTASRFVFGLLFLAMLGCFAISTTRLPNFGWQMLGGAVVFLIGIVGWIAYQLIRLGESKDNPSIRRSGNGGAVPGSGQFSRTATVSACWLARLAFLAIYLGFLGFVAWSAGVLPQRVAIHFDLSGHVNGWMNSSDYLVFIGMLPGAIAAFLMILGRLTQVMPARFVNIPRRDYWLAPERRVTTATFLVGQLLWLSCLMTCFFAGLHYLTIDANRVSPPSLAAGPLMGLVIAFMLALIIWITQLLMRMGNVKEEMLSAVPPGGSAKRVKNIFWSLLVALVVAAITNTFFLEAFSASTDAAAPEVPRGSRVLVWKLSHQFAPGDLIAYRYQGHANLGRVASADSNNLMVRRNNEADAAVPLADVVGKVITIYWRASSGTAPVTQPAPSAAEKFRRYTTQEPVFSKNLLPAGEGWHADCAKPQTLQLFEIADPNVGNCTVRYRASLKAEGLQGCAYLEMWVRLPGRGEFFSRGLACAVSGTTDWVTCETPFFFKGDESTNLIRLNLVVEGKGKVAIKDVELRRVQPATQPATGDTKPAFVNAVGTVGKTQDTTSQPTAGKKARLTIVLFAIPSCYTQTVVKNLGAKRTMTVDVLDADLKTLLAHGTLVAVENQIDEATGTLPCKATVSPTKDALLYPNQFVNVRLFLEAQPGAATESATNETPSSFSPLRFGGSSGNVPYAIPAAAKPAFGPVMERVVNDLQTSRENCALNFDTGKLLPVPADITRDRLSNNTLTSQPTQSQAQAWVKSQTEALAWAQKNQVDAIAFVNTADGKLVQCGLLCPDVLAIPADGNAWDQATPAQLKKEFARELSEWGFHSRVAELKSDGNFPTTYLILDTRTHKMGVLQITGVAENPRGVKLRCKLVQGGVTKASPASGPASATQPSSRLQFRLVADANDAAPADVLDDPDGREKATLRIRKEVLLDESAVAGAAVKLLPDGKAAVEVDFTPAGAKRMAEITGANIGKRLAVVFEGKMLSAPTIQSVIHGKAVITGNYTAAEVAQKIAQMLSVHEQKQLSPTTKPKSTTNP